METGVDLTADHVMAVRWTLGKFVHGPLSYQEVAMALTPILGTTQAIDRVDRILRTPLAPLPSNPTLKPESHPQCRAKTRPWSAYEDQRLIAGLHRLGTSDWFAVACFVGNSRTKSQCYQRWTRGLDPNINKTKWSPEQDSHLMMLVAVYGDKAWSKVSADIGNRCDVQCRYRYKQLMKDLHFPEMQRKARDAAAQFARTASPAPRKLRAKPVGRFGAAGYQPPVPYVPCWPPQRVEPPDYAPWQVAPQPRGPCPGLDRVKAPRVWLPPIELLPHSASGSVIFHNQPLVPAGALVTSGSAPCLQPRGS
jgi:hypothetical protein